MVQEYQPLDRVPEDVLPTLNYLRKKGFKLGLLSNRDDPLDDLVTSLGIAEAFDLMLAAGETGWWKPDPRVFRHAAARLDVAPEASVYVGDNYFADVVGAGEAGMQPVLLDPAGLFPEAACPVISSIGQLIPLLMGN
ncbi:MAG: HAD-IA family hydrolase [Deltaproteobacteria bacterium]|nr:HAD-IA family hydrolase [Deltaproteobacteria bacterium]